MQFFKIFIFAALIIGMECCAPTQTVTSTVTTTPAGRKRRSIDEELPVIIKVNFVLKNETKLYQVERFFLERLYTLIPDLASNIDKSTRLTSFIDGKPTTTIKISDSLTYCSRIMELIKDIIKKNDSIKDVTVKCGPKENVSFFN
uniref:Germane domain-containing protein n=1 Tax=Strongyloides stercoralis TaxID=6248 RepID=A0A0K0ERQ0_STRER